MTPRQQQEMERLKRRVRILERHRSRVAKPAIDRLIWLIHNIEAKPATDRFIRVPLSATDAKLFRRLVEGLVAPPEGIDPHGR